LTASSSASLDQDCGGYRPLRSPVRARSGGEHTDWAVEQLDPIVSSINLAESAARDDALSHESVRSE
jgi:hypothetical protein